MQVLEIAVAGFALPHGRGVQTEGGVQLCQVRFIWAAVFVVLIPDHHVFQAVHVASPPCTHMAGRHEGSAQPRGTAQSLETLGPLALGVETPSRASAGLPSL